MGLGFIAIIYLATYTEQIPYVLLIYMEAIHVKIIEIVIWLLCTVR